MRSSRRGFLNTTALAAAGVALSPLKIFSHSLLMNRSTAERRGLLFDQSDLPRIRETIQHPRFAPYWKTLLDADVEADRKFLTKELRLNNHVADMLRARQILERSSFVYAVVGDPRHLDIAKLAISRLMEYKKWDYFLEGGEETIGLQRAPEATIAMSFAREWLGDALTEDLRHEMEKQIAEKGAPACYRTLYGMKYPDRVRGWSFDPS